MKKQLNFFDKFKALSPRKQSKLLHVPNDEKFLLTIAKLTNSTSRLFELFESFHCISDKIYIQSLMEISKCDDTTKTSFIKNSEHLDEMFFEFDLLKLNFMFNANGTEFLKFAGSWSFD
jgi:hypothetical protein